MKHTSPSIAAWRPATAATILSSRRHLALAALTGLGAALALGWAPAARAQQPSEGTATEPAFQVSADGAFVIDRRARLAWARCVEGMDWDGHSCQGLPLLLSYKQAQARATERTRQESRPWRLPRVNELRRLIDRSAIPQGLNPALFPDAPRGWHWTGTVAVNARPVNPYNYSQISGQSPITGLSPQQAWAVNLDTLETLPDMGRGNQLMVRLVRPLHANDQPAP